MLLWTEHEDHEFYSHIFNGCYAGLMFVVVIFFLIYGVEVFFKVRGGFTVQNVPKIINSRRGAAVKAGQTGGGGKEELVCEPDERKPLAGPALCGRAGQLGNHGGQDIPAPAPLIDTSQLHQSRLGLLSQALMMIITVGFLLSETVSKAF